jgi:hypothetical protein
MSKAKNAIVIYFDTARKYALWTKNAINSCVELKSGIKKFLARTSTIMAAKSTRTGAPARTRMRTESRGRERR